MASKMKRSKFLIISIILYVLLYTILKLFMVFIDDLFMSNEIYKNEYAIGKIFKASKYSEEQITNTDYFSTKLGKYNFKVKNYFQDFEQGDKDSNYEYQLLYDEENKIKAAFMLGVFNDRLSTINDYNEDSYYYEFNHFPLYISETLRKSFLKRNDINNDIDLVKFIREREKINSNFFTPIYKMKENYFFNFVETTLPSLTTVTYIEKDYEGIIYESTNYKQACIMKDDKQYCLTFYKLDYFTDDIIYDVINSLIVEEE